MKFKTKNNIFLFGYQYYNCDSWAYPNLCPLTWVGTLGLILFIATPIVNLFSFIKSLFRKESFMETVQDEKLGGFGRFFAQLSVMVVYFFLVILAFDGDNLLEIPGWIWLYGWLFPLLIIALIVGGCFLVGGAAYGISESENLQVVKATVNAKFTKICPKIDWIKSDDKE